MLFNRNTEGFAARPRPPGDASDQAIRKTNAPAPQTVIDASVAIVGDLRSEGDVQLDGHLCGNVECRQLIVGPDAAITGAIVAEEVVARGRITGTIRARSVILQDTARVESDIVYRLLAVDEGATFEGSARRSPDPLNDAAAASALADLRRMLAIPHTEKTPCAADANGQANAGINPQPSPAIQRADGRTEEERRPDNGAGG
jgi:cytoskeletal protein CcmA (bactofilin family)